MTITCSQTSAGGGPVGSGEYIVSQGECVDSIAYEHGHYWKTIWDLPENAQLKQVRRDPNVLLEGDRLMIPPLRQKAENCATDAVHSFVLKGVPAMLRVRMLREDQKPRANKPYTLVIDGALSTGNTDGDGWVKHPIPPNSRHGEIRIGPDTFELCLGNIDPVSEKTGIRGRLSNLGYDCETENDIQFALARFQRQHGLPVSGEADQATRNKLVEVHGS
jgi:hypothetical protein